jgi:acyl dehydratase
MKKFYEAFEPGVVRETGSRTITETDIVIHAGQTGDFFPHHMDEEWCKTQPFKKRITHGTLVFSIAIGLTAAENNEASITYGYDHLLFIKPVFIGDTIKVRVTIKEKTIHKRPGYVLVAEQVEVFNQHGETALVCEHLLLVEKGQKISAIAIPVSAKPEPVKTGIDGFGLTALEGPVKLLDDSDWKVALYKPVKEKAARFITVKFIPYYAWANRGHNEMSVWLPVSR